MSGKPAARVTDPTACPLPGHGTNPIAEGSPDVMFDGLPAARQGDASACGSPIVSGVSSTVFINGQPAATLGSIGAHGNVIIGGSGTVIIGDVFTPAPFTPVSPLPSVTAADTAPSPTMPVQNSGSSQGVSAGRLAKAVTSDGCIFAKCSKLPDSEIDYSTEQDTFPVDSVNDYGNLVLLGGREADDSGKVQLKKISGNVPAGFGSLALRGLAPSVAWESCGGLCEIASAGGAVASGGRVAVETGGRVVGGGILTGGVVGGALLGVVAMLWPSSLGDSALYTEEQLRSMRQARTRVRIRVEERPDGTLKGYGYNTQLRSDWETIPVVQFARVGSQMVADFGGGVELIWTPAANPSDTLGIPALESAPQAPQITIYPPVEQADNLIVNPIYPPEYRDFILVFPASSGIAPLYIVMNARHDAGTVTGAGEDVFGIWLAGASEGLGAPIPTRIADRLRGREFSRFDDFREAFWIEVSRDAELASQFSAANRRLMRSGSSPFVVQTEAVGGRKVHELHHIERIVEGGAVYDVDNLRVATPRNHIRIHSSSKGQ